MSHLPERLGFQLMRSPVSTFVFLTIYAECSIAATPFAGPASALS